MAERIARTYGEALYSLAVEKNKTDEFFSEVSVILTAFDASPDLFKLLAHPQITKEEKVKVIENVLKGRVSDEITGFLTIIVTKERNKEIPEILEYFIDRVIEDKGIGKAYVTTAIPLDEIRKAQIKEKLIATTSYKEMEMEFDVDESLIAGMTIRIGDRVVDSSVSSKLSDLTRQLYKIRLG